ncbi:capsular polysaccharide export protein, LipB/KpsS family [Plebeiibacterium marinum]|uniref:Capsule polysaccharide biosynthesis protein n=1 Tax=Plebeiibacterium marinum TaxID=2992111 RepID=A0AAE3MGR2_9BACT|nr:hypothetical protein [Plebeiobacterium marinum]MCW3807469.1 hypothetical protein [Plebeiobacterium marinum]
MNIAAINFYHPYQKEAIELILDKLDVKIFYQFTYPQLIIENTQVDIQTYDLFALYFPLHIDDYYKSIPLVNNTEVLKYIQSLNQETNIYQMMDRLVHPDSVFFLKTYSKSNILQRYISDPDYFNKYISSLSLDEKMLTLKYYISFWTNFYLSSKLDTILFQEAPSMPFDFVGYLVAHYFKIKTILPEHTPIPGMRVFIKNIDEHAVQLNEYIQNMGDMNDKKFLSLLNPEFKKEIERVYYKQHYKQQPYYMSGIKFSKIRKAPNILNIFRNLNIDYFYAKLKKITNQYSQDNFIRQHYNKLANTNLDLSKKFIYFPLHLQPEKTTHPLGGIFADQLNALTLLSETLPKDVFIYIKENPKQTSAFRTSHFYNYISKLKNIELIPISFDTFKLIDECIAVATITGTAAWEGLWREKPALLFGSSCLNYCNGVYKINTKNDLEFFWKNHHKLKINISELKKFTLSLQNITYSLPYYYAYEQDKATWIDEYFKGYSGLMMENK